MGGLLLGIGCRVWVGSIVAGGCSQYCPRFLWMCQWLLCRIMWWRRQRSTPSAMSVFRASRSAAKGGSLIPGNPDACTLQSGNREAFKFKSLPSCWLPPFAALRPAHLPSSSNLMPTVPVSQRFR